MKAARGPGRTLAGGVADVGLPRWTKFAFDAIPLGVAITVLVQNTSTLPRALVFVLLAVSLLAMVVDELPVRIPELALGLAGITALIPILATDGQRLVLIIVGFIILRAATFGSLIAGAVVLAEGIGACVVAGQTEPGLPGAVFVMVGMVGAWAAGIAAREIIRIVGELRESERLRAEEAAREERRKLAREVHDVIAHSMTVTLLHVTGARMALRENPESAEQALQRAERVGRASLEDLRRTVRLLSESTDPTLGTTVDLGEDLERLRESFASAGAEIEMWIKGESESVPPFVALTVFRIVQESVTNAVRHAGGSRICVEVDIGKERVTLRIENSMGHDSEQSGGGRGLPGMFERAALVGGHIEAGPTKDGWLVAGWIPIDAPVQGLGTP